jgi:hypothetical protein
LAQQWAERLLAEHASDREELIRTAYRSAYGRNATGGDVKRANAFLDGAAGAVTLESVTDFCHALFNIL